MKPQDKVKRAECAAIIHRYTITEKQPVVTGASAIYDGKQAAPIIIDAAYTNNSADAHAGRTYNQIVRAVGDLRQDIAMVTGAIDFEEIQQIFKDSAEKQADRLTKAEQSKVPQLLTDTSVVKSDYAIIVGSVSDSAIIQKLTADGKLSEADAIKGQREAFVIKEVETRLKILKGACNRGCGCTRHDLRHLHDFGRNRCFPVVLDERRACCGEGSDSGKLQHGTR